MSMLPVLDVGGTHATAMLVDTTHWTVNPDSIRTIALRANARADELLDNFASCVTALDSAGGTLAVAMPGPFDYPAGVGRFRDVGKFESLNGVDVGVGLRTRLRPPPDRILFVNDAVAFGLGEWLVGAAREAHRAVAITLGTGIGSAFVADGSAVCSGPSVPPDGFVHRLTIDGRPLESVVSRRAIIARYGEPDVDVREIAERAAAGDKPAHAALTEPLTELGRALTPWLSRFEAEVLVVGGAISGAWPLVQTALRRGLHTDVPIRRASDSLVGSAIGAGWHTLQTGGNKR